MASNAKTNAVGWFEIYVEDMQRARKFYESVFATQLESLRVPTEEDDLEMWSFPGHMDRYGAAGALVRMPGFPVGQNSVIVYFSCEDCAVEEKRVADAGGRVEKSKFSIGEHGFISIVIDTEGNIFGLHSMK